MAKRSTREEQNADKNSTNIESVAKKGDEKSDEQEGNGQIIPEDVIEKLPPPVREIVRSSMSMVMSGSAPHPLLSKINPDHISSIIDASEKDSERDFQDNQSSRKWNFAWLIAICLFILLVFGLLIYAQKAEYIVPIGTAMLGFAGGFGSGLGVERYKRKE